MDCYSYPIFFPLFLEWLSTSLNFGHRRTWTEGQAGIVDDRAVTISKLNAVNGMFTAYEVDAFDNGADAKTIDIKCQSYSENSDEATLYQAGAPALYGAGQKLCELSMAINAMGNKICNGRLNVPAYDFDSGDCCLPELQCVSPYHALIFDF